MTFASYGLRFARFHFSWDPVRNTRNPTILHLERACLNRMLRRFDEHTNHSPSSGTLSAERYVM